MSASINRFLVLTTMVAMASCNQVTLVIENLPDNTPPDSQIHIAGNFNYWDPADPNFVLSKHEKGYYYFSLPPGIGEYEFLTTRGDWTTVEGDLCGNGIEKHLIKLINRDTVRIEIDSWMDLGPTNCPKVTFVVDEVPENTPVEDNIYISGNFNSWNPGSDKFKMIKSNDSKFYYTFESDSILERIEFKFTRGDWNRVEVDENGVEFPFHQYAYGYVDTINIRIPNWADFAIEKVGNVTFIITDMPKETPLNDPIYIAGSFNSWYPRDNNFELTRQPNGNYAISLNQKKGSMEYMFCRGSWETVEIDPENKSPHSRMFKYESADTVYISISGWQDIKDM